jgi:hypothetical protein
MSRRISVAVGIAAALMTSVAPAAAPNAASSAPARTTASGKASAATAKAAAATPATATTAPSAASAVGAGSAPVDFIGLLDTGTTYVGDMTYDAQALRTWRPVKPVHVPKNVAWTIDWTNIDKFPQLKSAAGQAKPQRFRFKVVKNDVVSGSPVMPWMSTYSCEILSVEPVAVAGVSKAAPKSR